MIITTLSIVPPEGIFTCCPEAKIKINLIRPELFLEFDEDTEITYDYKLVNPLQTGISPLIGIIRIKVLMIAL